MDLNQLLQQLWNLIVSFTQLSPMGKVSGIVLFVIAVWKSSFAQPLWAKLGNYQTVVAPALGVVVALLSIQPFSWSLLGQSLLAGGLAIGLHQLMDVVKVLPGLGSIYVSGINFVENLLWSPRSQKMQAKALKGKNSHVA